MRQVQTQGMSLPPPPRGTGKFSPFAPTQAPNAPGALPPSAPGTYAGQKTVGASAGPMDYASIQGFSDDALTQARRHIDPAQDQARRRMEQDMINKGVDPRSDAGMAMMDQQSRNFADQDQSALFNALQFGTNIQNQMFGQSMANTQQAGQMQQAEWQRDIAARGQDINKYGMDQNFELGMGNLDVTRQGQDFNQMMGLEANQFRNRAYADKRSDYQDALTMSLMGMTPVPGVIGYDPTALAGMQLGGGGGGFFSGI